LGVAVIVALVPAAGRSERMGQPKLILSIGGVPLIARVVAALRDGGAARVIVVAPPVREPGASSLIEAAQCEGAEVVVADSPPPDMRASVELGLARIADGPEPIAILLTPGDIPGLGSGDVAQVIQASMLAPGRIIVPRHEGHRGHPVLIPWSLASQVPGLPRDVGVNALLKENADLVLALEMDGHGILDDLDTPYDYRAWTESRSHPAE
jgi:molybdenum cofactor cytidylyltransferase